MQLRIARGAELVSVGGKTRMPFKPQINRMKVQKSTRVRSRARAHKWRPTRTRDVTVIVQRRRGGPGMTTRESVTAGKKKTDGIGRDEHFPIHSLSIDWLLLLIVSFYLFFFFTRRPLFLCPTRFRFLCFDHLSTFLKLPPTTQSDESSDGAWPRRFLVCFFLCIWRCSFGYMANVYPDQQFK